MIIQSTVVGISFRPAEAKEAMRNLAPDDILWLEAEPSNPHDANAVKVIDPTTEEFIGYLSRDTNFEVSQYLRETEGEYTCRIISFLSSMKPSVEIELFDVVEAEGGED